MMQKSTLSCLVSAVLLVSFSASPSDADDGYVMLMLWEPGPRGIASQKEFSNEAKPGPGKTLGLRIEADLSCRAIVAAFNRAGSMTYPGLPSESAVKEHSIIQLPTAGSGNWTWEGHEELAEMDVLLVSGDSGDLRDLSKLLVAMRDTSLPETIRKRQAADLRRWIDRQSQNASEASDYSIKQSPIVIGGMMRGDCGWCKSAHKVSIPASGAAVVRIHLD